jgi:predicted DNA-binding transcriptional regulator AlpA
MSEHARRLRPPQAAEYLGGLSTSTLAKWRVSGFGPRYMKCGARVVYDREDLDSWLETRARENTSQRDLSTA